MATYSRSSSKEDARKLIRKGNKIFYEGGKRVFGRMETQWGRFHTGFRLQEALTLDHKTASSASGSQDRRESGGTRFQGAPGLRPAASSRREVQTGFGLGTGTHPAPGSSQPGVSAPSRRCLPPGCRAMGRSRTCLQASGACGDLSRAGEGSWQQLLSFRPRVKHTRAWRGGRSEQGRAGQARRVKLRGARQVWDPCRGGH